MKLSTDDALDQVDLSLFHEIYSRPDLTTRAATESYLLHVGFRRYHILKMVRDAVIASFKRTDGQNRDVPVFDEHWRLCPTVIPPELGTHSSLYFNPCQTDSIPPPAVLVSEPVNELYDAGFPSHLRFCTMQPIRQDLFSSRTGRPARLFCGSRVYQVYDSIGNVFWPTASPFSLTKSISFKRNISTDRDIVFVGDIFGGSNFSHFLFDGITRMSHFATRDRSTENRPIFVFNSVEGEFQQILVNAAAKLFSFSPEDVFFPTSSTNIETSGQIFWFSDSYQFNQHPAQLMSRTSVDLLKAVCDAVQTPDRNVSKVYVSRADARQRRIVNEQGLIDALKTHGFIDVTLSGLSVIEQISIIRGAKTIVAPHGMGLTLCAFNRGPLKLIELFSTADGSGTDAYAVLARAFGFDYQYLLGPAQGGDFYVDIDAVVARL